MTIKINGIPLQQYVLKNRDSWNRTQINIGEIRQALELKGQGKENREIAEILKLNEDQIRYRLKKAKELGLSGRNSCNRS